MIGSLLQRAALDISFGEFLWSLLVIFGMIVFFILLFYVVIDLFRDRELSGWWKAVWLLFIIVIPFLGILVYLIARGGGMAERAQKEAVQQAKYMQQLAGGPAKSPTEQIADAKALLDSGAISQEEFDAIKAKALG